MISLGWLSSKVGDRPGTQCARAVLFFFVTSLQLLGCTPVGVPTTQPEPTGPPIPPINTQELSRSESRRGGELLRAARDSLNAGAHTWVSTTAQTLIRDYPGLSGSGEAFALLARAEFQTENFSAAADASRSYRELVGPSHPHFPEYTLLEARALRETGETAEALEALLELPPGTGAEILGAALDLSREAIPPLTARTLGALTEALPANSPLRGLMATEWAVALYLRGDGDEAVEWAQVALRTELGDRERERAQSVVDGRLEEVLGRPVILGVVLPRSGVSPSALQYADWIYEGIQVAVAEFQPLLRRPVQLELVDDRGTPLGGRTAIRSLDGYGAMGAIGFMGQEVLEEATATRQGGFPLVSPFSFLPPEENPGVYSLSGPDPGEARQLARAAWELDLETVAIVRPGTEEARIDAEAFQEEFQALGGLIPRDIVFDSGATFFQPQFQEVEELLPDGLFLPISPRDIRLLAPQITFYGVDTLGAQILGTSGWTEDVVVMDVDSRHTDGVIAATTRLTQDDSESFRRFEEAYEAFFHKTLRSQVPAFGYDAAAVILKALEAGPRNPQELMAAMEEIRGFSGATGVLSVEGGRISRTPLMVRIQDHELIYIIR
jgi:ABC-type branched-subunit amino acid transport system substrate-binding protein